jgi:site-specific recombinase XerD
MTTTRSTKSEHLIYGYQICASTEGKSPAAITAVTQSVKIFLRFLNSQCGGMPVTEVTYQEIRAFIFHLQHAKCFSVHPTIHVLDKGLSGHTVNCYLRSLRIFFSWLVSEDILPNHPFEKVKIPRPPTKIIPAFSPSQIQQLLSVINTRTPAGYRDYLIILTLLDTGLRVSELCSMTLEKLWLEDGTTRVLGKGNKERLVPIGKKVQRLLWHYIERYRAKPVTANCSSVFLTEVQSKGVEIVSGSEYPFCSEKTAEGGTHHRHGKANHNREPNVKNCLGKSGGMGADEGAGVHTVSSGGRNR